MPFTTQDLGWISLAAAVLLSVMVGVRLIVALPRRTRRAAAPLPVPEPVAQPADHVVSHH